MKSNFTTYHPTVNFLYFGLILAFSMTFIHPLCRFFSLFGAFAWSFYLMGRKALQFQLKMILPMMLMTAIINPAFSHEGMTILTYLPSNNPLTLEAICYGLSMALMLASVIVWFSCYHETMSTDKLIYLFGHRFPAMSLILSMALRFVPRFKDQLNRVKNAQYCIGRGTSSGTIWQKLINATRILSITVTWSFENAIETADSMKSRGYGEGERTSFSIYRFESRDKTAFLIIAGLGILVLFTAYYGGFYWNYYPSMQGSKIKPITISAFLFYLALCLLPIIIEKWEDRRWNSFESKT